MNLAPYIRELVATNECIILPDFGGLETRYSPAEFDSVNKIMLPPDKIIEFKPEYTKGGESLAYHLCLKLGIPNNKSKELIEAYVADLKNELQSNNEVNIEQVGTFYYNEKGAICFSAFKEENYLVDSFGLEPLSVRNIEIDKPSKDLKGKILSIKPRNNTFIIVIIGIVIVSLLMVLTIFISSKFEVYLFNIGDDNANSEYIVLGGIPDNDTTVKQIEKQLIENTSVKNALLFDEPSSKTEVLLSEYYILVAGSFKTYSNAEEVKRKLTENGFKVEIIEAGGYYRTSIGRFEDKNTALSELQRLRTQIDRSVWLLTVNNN